MASERQIEFWQKTLEGAPALTVAPTDRSRPAAANSQHYGSLTQQLPGALVDSICRDTPSQSPKGTLVAVWQVYSYLPDTDRVIA